MWDRKRILRAALLYAGAAFALILTFVAFFQLRSFQRHLCPPDTQVWGANDISLILVPIPVTLIGVAFGPALARRIRRAQAESTTSVPTLLPLAGWLGVAALVLWVILTVNAVFSYYCITPREILLSSNLFTGPKIYEWTSVERVVAQCSHVSGPHPRDVLRLELVTREGQVFDAARGPLYVAVKTVSGALADLSYSYDVAGVLDTCPAQYRAALLSPALAAHLS